MSTTVLGLNPMKTKVSARFPKQPLGFLIRNVGGSLRGRTSMLATK